MKWIIDRIEGNIVICEDDDRKMHPFERSDFEGEPKEGDIVYEQNGRMVSAPMETEKRKKEMEQKFRKLLDR